MSDVLSRRLQMLDAILAGSRSTVLGSAQDDLDAVEMCLRVVPFDRMRQLTAMLRDSESRGIDAAETVAARLLLNDYRNAVANLRAATQVVAGRLTATSASLKPIRGFMHRRAKHAEKQRARRG